MAAAGRLELGEASPVLRQQFQRWLAKNAALRAPGEVGAKAARTTAAASPARASALASSPSSPAESVSFFPAASPSEMTKRFAETPYTAGSEFPNHFSRPPSDDWRLRRVDHYAEQAMRTGLKSVDYLGCVLGAGQVAIAAIDALDSREHPMAAWASEEATAIAASFRDDMHMLLQRPVPPSDGGRETVASFLALQDGEVQLAAIDAVQRTHDLVERFTVARDLYVIQQYIITQVGEVAIDEKVWHALYSNVAHARMSQDWYDAVSKMHDLLNAVGVNAHFKAGQWAAKMEEISEMFQLARHQRT